MKNKSLILAFYFSPFLNIVSYRVGDLVAYVALIVLLAIAYMYSPRKGNRLIYEKKILYIDILYLFVVLILGALSLVLGINNLYYIRFFGVFFAFILYFYLVRGEAFFFDGLITFLRYLIVVVFVSICGDAILMLWGLETMQPMYDPEKWTYLTRPFGVFGQPSVNSCLLCFFYIFQRSLTKRYRKKVTKDWYFLLVLAGCVVQGSGSGFISLIFAVISKFNRQKALAFKTRKVMPLIIFVLLAFIYIVRSNAVEKVSMVYFDELVDYTLMELWYPYLESAKNTIYVLFGVPETNLSIDLGPLYIIATVGVLFFLLLTSFFLLLLNKTNDFDMKLGLCSLLIGNLHYPVMFYFVMNFLWFYIVYYIFVAEKVDNNEKKKIRRCYINVQSQSFISSSAN